MFCPEEMRVNKFKECCLPSNRSLFGRIPEKKDRDVNVVDIDIPSSMSKIESFEFMEKYDSMMQSKEHYSSADDSSVNRDSQNDDSSGES